MDGNSMTVSNIGKTSVNTGELKMEATLNEHNEYEKSFLTPQKKTSTVGKYSVFNQCGKAIILTPDIVDGKTSIGEKALECSDGEEACVNQLSLQAQVVTQNGGKPCEQKEHARASVHSTSCGIRVRNHTAKKGYG